MTSFQITFYFLNNQRKVEQLEKSFIAINDQLELFEKQHSSTIKNYLKSWQEELDDLTERYKKSEKSAQQKYDETIGDSGPNNQDNIAYATHISGIDYLAHRKQEEVEVIKAKYSDFLDLFSKSTLIGLYSLNESFLSKVCNLSSQTFEKKIKLSHFSQRDYLLSSFNYLELVIDIPIEPFEKYVSKLKDVQSIRNKIIHEGSEIKDSSILKTIEKYSPNLFYDKEKEFLKIVNSNFNKDFFELLKNLYQELLWQFEERQKYKTIKSILENWFGLIEGKITISEVNSTKTSSKKRTIDFKIDSDNEKVPELKGKLSLTTNKGYEVEIIDQSENELIKELLEAEKDLINLNLELKTFMTFDKNLDIRLLIY
jgi:hypothetical protein